MVNQLPGGGGYLWICSHCKEEFNSSYSRVKAHLCFIPQQDIKFCTRKPRVNGVLPKTFLPNHIVNKYIQEQNQADEESARASSYPLQNARKKQKHLCLQLPLPMNHPLRAIHSCVLLKKLSFQRREQWGPWNYHFKMKLETLPRKAIARCIYSCGLAFNVVRSPYWQQMARSINEAPKGFKGPGYEKVRTTLLDNEVLNVEASMKLIKDSWIEIGVTIVSDGWKDARNRPLVNVIVVSTRGAMFLRVVDCE